MKDPWLSIVEVLESEKNKYENVLKNGILLSIFSTEELMEKYKGSIYYDDEHPENNIYQLCLVDSCMENILRAREKNPLNDGIGYLYLHEVYEKLGLKYTGDRNIGITTKSRNNWGNLYSPKRCHCVEYGEPNQNGKYETWYWTCSECGQVIMPQFHYCPKCGGEIV